MWPLVHPQAGLHLSIWPLSELAFASSLHHATLDQWLVQPTTIYMGKDLFTEWTCFTPFNSSTRGKRECCPWLKVNIAKYTRIEVCLGTSIPNHFIEGLILILSPTQPHTLSNKSLSQSFSHTGFTTWAKSGGIRGGCLWLRSSLPSRIARLYEHQVSRPKGL